MDAILEKRVKKYTAPEEYMQKGLYTYFRPLETAQDTIVFYKGRKLLMFGSNSYLGLTNHPYVKERVIKAVEKYGSGCGGSPFLNGRLDIHEQLEEELAKFVGKESAIVFSTGFQANLGTISALCSRNDCVILDESVHASIIDGVRLSYAKVFKYKHNDMKDLLKVASHINNNSKDSSKLIIVDGVFSMEGDICNLQGVVSIAKEYGLSVMVDDAHGIGVVGPNGRGTCMLYNVTDDVDIIMGTFSKSLASVGGFIASSKSIVNYLRHHSRSLIFSASISPACAAAALAALEIIKKEPERIEKLWKNTHFAIQLFKKYSFNIGNTKTPIIPVYIGDVDKTFLFTKSLEELGIFVNPIVAPAVKPEHSLIRFSLMATHTFEQIEYAITKMYEVAKKIKGILRESEDNMEENVQIP